MKNKISRKPSILQFEGIKTVLFFLFVSCILPTRSFAESAKHWITLAESVCISDANYIATRGTEVYQESAGKGGAQATRKLIKKGGTRLAYTKKTGLKPIPPKKSKDKTAPDLKASVFTLDIGHMLQKMKGKVKWVLENENESLDKQACVVLSSSGEKWLVRLWIRKKDNVVLRYDQHLNNKFVGTSRVEYGKPRKGKYFPAKTTTKFNLTNHIIIQQYYDYVFTEPIK